MRYSSYSNSASRDRGARREQMTAQLLRQDSDIGGGLSGSLCYKRQRQQHQDIEHGGIAAAENQDK